MLRLLKNTIFSSAVHRASDMIKNVRTIFETSDAQLLDALCDVNTEGNRDVRQKYTKWLWRKKFGLTRSIVIKLPVRSLINRYSDQEYFKRWYECMCMCHRASSTFQISFCVEYDSTPG